jgi:two-component system chemotaxis response regulator CheB
MMSEPKKKLRVLVVDDSAYNRRVIADILSSHPDIEVVGMADDGEKALKAAASLRPDLITLDLEMPRMDGFTFLRIIMSQMPTPVIVVSSQSHKQSVFQVLELGALDFIAKPARFFAADAQQLRNDIINKALSVRSLQIVPFTKRASSRDVQAAVTATKVPLTRSVSESIERVVVVGASTGGPPALQALFKSINNAAGTAFLVAQHMPEKFTKAFAERLDRLCELSICEAEDGMAVRPGAVYIAPGGNHLLLAGQMDSMFCRVVKSTPADRYAPCIDKLFESAAPIAKERLLAAVLTGMGADGSVGVRAIHKAGGRVIAESQETAIVYGMPKEAVGTGCVHESLPLEGIISHIHAFARAH